MSGLTFKDIHFNNIETSFKEYPYGDEEAKGKVHWG